MKVWMDTPLFDYIPPSVTTAYDHDRSAAIRAAYDKAMAPVKESYYAFAVAYAASHDEFSVENITDAFKADPHTLKPLKREDNNEWKFLGQMTTRLLKEGIIHDTGRAKRRANGNLTAIYEGRGRRQNA